MWTSPPPDKVLGWGSIESGFNTGEKKHFCCIKYMRKICSSWVSKKGIPDLMKTILPWWFSFNWVSDFIWMVCICFALLSQLQRLSVRRRTEGCSALYGHRDQGNVLHICWVNNSKDVHQNWAVGSFQSIRLELYLPFFKKKTKLYSKINWTTRVCWFSHANTFQGGINSHPDWV